VPRPLNWCVSFLFLNFFFLPLQSSRGQKVDADYRARALGSTPLAMAQRGGTRSGMTLNKAFNFFVLLIAGSFLTWQFQHNHSMIQRQESRINAKLQALQRDVQSLKEQLQDKDILLANKQQKPFSMASADISTAGSPQPVSSAVLFGAPALPSTPSAQVALAPGLQPAVAPNSAAALLLPLPPVKWKARSLTFNSLTPKLLQMDPPEAIRVGKQYVEWQANHFKREGGKVWGGARATGNKKNIERIWIWGERNSCTTIVMAILKRNFVLGCSEGMSPGNLTRCIKGGVPWKHDFTRRADLDNQHNTINLLVTRHPYEWISSMQKHPYYAYMHEDVKMLDFVTREWLSFYHGAGGQEGNLIGATKMKPKSEEVTQVLGDDAVVTLCVRVGLYC